MNVNANAALLTYYGVSNTPGNPGNLLEICKVCWKFSGLVREFARLSLILVTVMYFRVYQ